MQWLNDIIVNATLSIIEELSNGKIKVVDSLTLRARGKVSPQDFGNAKVLLPLHIDNNHWVLGVVSEDHGKILLIDSLPSGRTKQAAADYIKFFYKKLLQTDDIWPQIVVISPLVQENHYDCGVALIIAAFHVAMDLEIEPDTDASVWRDVLFQLLQSLEAQGGVAGHAIGSLEQQIELLSLSVEATPSEVPTALSQLLCGISVNLMDLYHKTQRTLSTADSALKIVGIAKEAAVNAEALDIQERFQRVGEYCAMIVEKYSESARYLGRLTSKMRFVNNELRESRDELDRRGELTEETWVEVRLFTLAVGYY